MKIKFKPGLELNRAFFKEVIKPLIDKKFPDLEYSAGLIGYGSDTLGVDTHTSMDHNWGPRCILFLKHEDMVLAGQIKEFLSNNLPFEFDGFPTNYSDPMVDFTQTMKPTNSYPIRHMIEVHEIDGYFNYNLDVKNHENISIQDWLKLNDQILIELTTGEVFYDGLNKLNRIREKVQNYPEDILKLKLASLWLSIANEEPFVGRAIDLGDFIGLKLISTRIVNTLIKIAFYMEKKYIPYGKWFSVLFNMTESGKILKDDIKNLLTENNPKVIEDILCVIYEKIIDMHNSCDFLPKIDNKVQNFHERPYKVIFAEGIVETLVENIKTFKTEGIDLNRVAMDIKLDSMDLTEMYEL